MVSKAVEVGCLSIGMKIVRDLSAIIFICNLDAVAQ